MTKFIRCMSGWKSFLKRTLFGIELPDEYVCAPLHSFSHSLSVTLTLGGQHVDVTDCHILLGYKPVIIGIYLHGSKLQVMDGGEGSLQFKSVDWPQAVVAELTVKHVTVHAAGGEELHCFECTYGQHNLINRFHRRTNRIRESLRSRKAGNVSLNSNLYEQVRIAYSVPRVVSVISLGDGDRFNFFPTDLHGPFGRSYVGSLRHGGKACAQVELLKKVVISNMKPETCRETYAWGKNHMQDLRPLENFAHLNKRSPILGLPLPVGCIYYRELTWRSSFDIGLHRLHFYDVLGEGQIEESDSLSHVHQYYAQWRMNRGIHTPWLLR